MMGRQSLAALVQQYQHHRQEQGTRQVPPMMGRQSLAPLVQQDQQPQRQEQATLFWRTSTMVMGSQSLAALVQQ